MDEHITPASDDTAGPAGPASHGFESPEGLRALLIRLHEAGPGAWRGDREAAELMRYTAVRYRRLARRYRMDAWEVASMAFEVMLAPRRGTRGIRGLLSLAPCRSRVSRRLVLPARGDVGDERGASALAAVLSRSLHDAASVALAVLGMLLLGVESLTGDPLDPIGVGFILVAGRSRGLLRSRRSYLPLRMRRRKHDAERGDAGQHHATSGSGSAEVKA